MRAAYLFFTGAIFAVLWIAEIVRGIAYDRGHRVHLIASIISVVVAPALWFGGPRLAAVSDPRWGPTFEIVATALAAGAALLALIELARWLQPEEV
jgi:hypothetical protein